jgi:hypothetical protein
MVLCAPYILYTYIMLYTVILNKLFTLTVYIFSLIYKEQPHMVDTLMVVTVIYHVLTCNSVQSGRITFKL